MRLKTVEGELIAAKPYFNMVSPGPSAALRGWPSRIMAAYSQMMRLRKHWDKPWPEFIGAHLADEIIQVGLKPMKQQVIKGHMLMPKIKRDRRRKNGLGGRSWIETPGQLPMVIIFHDANRAGPHIDVHIGRLSLIYSLRNKPHITEQLRYNREGYLTENSKKILLDHVRSEIGNRSRVPQNLDHSMENARTSWVGGSRADTGYGAATTRQIVAESTVDVYKAGTDQPVELYAPLLNSHRGLYIYEIYKGEKTGVPILIFGALTHHPSKLEDRLHLKMVDPAEMDKAIEKRDIDIWSMTAKYDGSSAYIVIGPKGTTVWSPRISKVTSEAIEYTPKLDGIANVHSDETIVAMGEILFHRKGNGRVPRRELLSQAEGGGLLNSNSVLPTDVTPEIRLYRVDRIGREKTVDLPFWENRELQERVAKLSPRHLKVVELMSPVEAKEKGFEGVVAVPRGASVNQGVKMKWWQDADDWTVREVNLRRGDRGGIAGEVWFESESINPNTGMHKVFKLGPSSVGNRPLQEAMMADPKAWEGTVMKVQSRHGHEARAAKVLSIHDDKGLAPY